MAWRTHKDAVVIGSKWGYSYVGAWRHHAPVHEVKDLSLDTLRRQVSESRSLLGDRLQLYEIHSATLESRILEDVAVLRELLRLRAGGLIIGLTVTGPDQPHVIRRALQVSVDGLNPFQVVQATWNLLERSAASALEEAKTCGWGVIVKEALANGRLTDRGDGEHLTTLRARAKTSSQIG
jgi:aryl-alcohol dehydrogenase-like predicted oxidoreductase